ncbi:hypothetical protein BH24ACT20_BH24ACT20_14850 [soil metagenome]
MSEGETALPQDQTIEQILSSVKEALGMEVAFVSEFVDDRLVFCGIEGDVRSFGFEKDGHVPLERSYCKRVIDGRLPNVIPDARTYGETRDLPVTDEADIGSYVAVPLMRHDGRPYGTLCCLSHTADSLLRDRDLGLMEKLAQRMVARLDQEGLL